MANLKKMVKGLLSRCKKRVKFVKISIVLSPTKMNFLQLETAAADSIRSGSLIRQTSFP